MSKFTRVEQWCTFARTWYLFDAKCRDAFDAGERVTRYLFGRHKPIYDTWQDMGDHVVVINARHVSLPNDEWKWRFFYHHTRYAGGATWASAWEMHEKDPTWIMYKSVYKAIGIQMPGRRHEMLGRCHIFADEVVPKHIMDNVTDQIRQLRRVDKSINDYTERELDEFPKIFDYPDKYAIK